MRLDVGLIDTPWPADMSALAATWPIPSTTRPPLLLVRVSCGTWHGTIAPFCWWPPFPQQAMMPKESRHCARPALIGVLAAVPSLGHQVPPGGCVRT